MLRRVKVANRSYGGFKFGAKQVQFGGVHFERLAGGGYERIARDSRDSKLDPVHGDQILDRKGKVVGYVKLVELEIEVRGVNRQGVPEEVPSLRVSAPKGQDPRADVLRAEAHPDCSELSDEGKIQAASGDVATIHCMKVRMEAEPVASVSYQTQPTVHAVTETAALADDSKEKFRGIRDDQVRLNPDIDGFDAHDNFLIGCGKPVAIRTGSDYGDIIGRLQNPRLGEGLLGTVIGPLGNNLPLDKNPDNKPIEGVVINGPDSAAKNSQQP